MRFANLLVNQTCFRLECRGRRRQSVVNGQFLEDRNCLTPPPLKSITYLKELLRNYSVKVQIVL